MKVILALDNDSAGEQFVKTIKNEYSELYNIRVVTPQAKDWGEASIDEIKGKFNVT